MKLKGKKIPIDGRMFYFMESKTIEENIKYIALLNSSSEGTDYSLWYIEILNEKEFAISPYDGNDSQELIMELMELFLENAHELL